MAEAFTGNEALNLFEKVNPVLVILDLMLPALSGEEAARGFGNAPRFRLSC